MIVPPVKRNSVANYFVARLVEIIMSRIGNAPIPIPSGVEVVVDDHLIKVKGPKGNLEQETVPQVSVQVEDNQILVSTTTENRFSKAIQGQLVL